MIKRLLSALAALYAFAGASAYELIDGRLEDSAYYPATVHTYRISTESHTHLRAHETGGKLLCPRHIVKK
ncbi:MAG: hypothetical protein K2M55_00210, partial [Muribaculaceae bacterium]|nr:hypothetical protein [Muribaculaceae bacterium]